MFNTIMCNLSAITFVTLFSQKVAVLDIQDKDEAIANLQKEFPDKQVIYVRTDVTDRANVQRSFEQAKVEFGHLDIVIGNAGIADEVNAEKTIQVNLVNHTIKQ